MKLSYNKPVVLLFVSLDRFWEDSHIPVADIFSYKHPKICRASTDNCAHTRTWYSSESFCYIYFSSKTHIEILACLLRGHHIDLENAKPKRDQIFINIMIFLE